MGYGLQCSNYEDILTVSEYDYGSGKGSKPILRRPRHSLIPQDAPIPVQLALLRKIIKNSNNLETNEVNMNIKDINNIKFIFYCTDNIIYSNEFHYSEDLLKMTALYLSRKIDHITGKNRFIPLRKYRNGEFDFIFYPCKDEIENMLIKILKNDFEMFKIENIDFWHTFANEAKNSSILKRHVFGMLDAISLDISSKLPTEALSVIELMEKLGYSSQDSIQKWISRNVADDPLSYQMSSQIIQSYMKILERNVQKINESVIPKEICRKLKIQNTQLKATIFLLKKFNLQRTQTKEKFKNFQDKKFTIPFR